MALCNIIDINLEILSWISDLKLFIYLSILNKKSYIFITNTLIYAELDTLKNCNIKIGNVNIINKCYSMGLVNILKILKKNNECFISNIGINLASVNGHINILEWYKNSGLEFKYTEYAIDWASGNGARINYAFTMHN